jgi:hypothetical protein
MEKRPMCKGLRCGRVSGVSVVPQFPDEAKREPFRQHAITAL